MPQGKKILICLTNTCEFRERRDLTGLNLAAEDAQKTGFDIKEVAYLYEMLSKKHNLELIFASPRGGECFIDPQTCTHSKNDEYVKKFLQDHQALQQIKNTQKLRDLKQENFMCAVFPGGPGVLFDLPNESEINQVVQDIWTRKHGTIAAIGHGIAALLNVKTEKGELWLKNKRVTCQTVEEEKELKLERTLPFMVENKLREIGAKIEKSSVFQPNVVEDERLITAQNNYSTKEWVERIAHHCGTPN